MYSHKDNKEGSKDLASSRITSVPQNRDNAPSQFVDISRKAYEHEKLQYASKSSDKVQKAMQLQALANQYSQKKSKSLQDVMQLQAIRGGGNLSGTVIYTPQANNGIASAFEMKAKNITRKAGKAGLAGANDPEVDPAGWAGIKALGLTGAAPNYKRMHLLNAQLGGHGNKIENLAPGSTDLNNTHFRDVEDALQKHVLAGGTITSYDVWAVYRAAGLPRFSAANASTYKHTLKELHCQYVLDNGTGDSLVITEDAKTAAKWP